MDNNLKICDTCHKEKFIPNGRLCAECWAKLNSFSEQSPPTAEAKGSAEFNCSVVDLAKIAELGQAYAHFELIRTMATQAQGRFGKHLSIDAVECMGDIAKDADRIIGQVMATFDAAK